MFLWPLIMGKLPLVLFLMLGLLWPIRPQAQCSMCKAVAESSLQGGSPIAEGLNDGILYLMAFPYLLLSILGIAYYRYQKRRKAELRQPVQTK